MFVSGCMLMSGDVMTELGMRSRWVNHFPPSVLSLNSSLSLLPVFSIHSVVGSLCPFSTTMVLQFSVSLTQVSRLYTRGRVIGDVAHVGSVQASVFRLKIGSRSASGSTV